MPIPASAPAELPARFAGVGDDRVRSRTIRSDVISVMLSMSTPAIVIGVGGVLLHGDAVDVGRGPHRDLVVARRADRVTRNVPSAGDRRSRCSSTIANICPGTAEFLADLRLAVPLAGRPCES